ncbi:MAG TPA: outer membrane lipoprotein carrier protein LolA [Thermoanaerobaculia bacterium]|nr:outer membrane lipoprotein carrier protein LolA [Thermoanaerobaculia bacterium]
MKPVRRTVSRHRFLLLAASTLFAWLVPASLVTASPPQTADPLDTRLSGTARVEALIARVKAAQQEVETLEASFVQRQESSMLVEPDVSRGVFSYSAPDAVRWEYSSPKPISVVIDGEEMLTWYRDLGRAERLKVGRYSNQVLKYLGASGSFDTLFDYFRVRVAFPGGAGEPYRLELTPRYDRIARRLSSMTVWIDPVRFLPVRMRYVAGDGDVTEYEFSDLEVNRGIPAARFVLDLPASVEVREVDLAREGG